MKYLSISEYSFCIVNTCSVEVKQCLAQVVNEIGTSMPIKVETGVLPELFQINIHSLVANFPKG